VEGGGKMNKYYELKEIRANNLGVGCSTRWPLTGVINVFDNRVKYLLESAEQNGTGCEMDVRSGIASEEGYKYSPGTLLVGYKYDKTENIYYMDKDSELCAIIGRLTIEITKSPIVAFCERKYPEIENRGDLDEIGCYDGGVITFAPRKMDGREEK